MTTNGEVRRGKQLEALTEMQTGARLFHDMDRDKMWLEGPSATGGILIKPIFPLAFKALTRKGAVRVKAGTDIFATTKEYILNSKFNKIPK